MTTSGTTFSCVVTAAGGVGGRVTIPLTATVLPGEVTSVSAQNLIVVGGPCANSVTAAVMYTEQGQSLPDNCAQDFTPGEGIIAVYDIGDNVALVAAGFSADDTRRTGKVLAQAGNYNLQGSQVKVTGTSFTDIDVVSVE